MSQNKTVIQGLTPDENMGGMTGMYARGAQPAAARGTIVPGMESVAGGQAQPAMGSSTAPQHRVVQPGKPVVGFLYSISRTQMGEYWPLQIGRNTIGQDDSSDIVLKEGTVSGNHAVIIVRQIKNTGGVIAAVTDTQSTNGTMINGETIGFQAVECHSGDILTVGNNYELVLVLIDASKYKLSVAEGFIPVEASELEDDFSDVPSFGAGNTQAEGYQQPWQGGEYVGNGGTVGLDGSTPGYNNGGTVSM
ncbi:MAG: FHA domain-containing protein [Prevotellamassilia sp.]|jgi:hypothetical protein|nr:FHA domain-containing protein [Prevotellamassilia sp.]